MSLGTYKPAVKESQLPRPFLTRLLVDYYSSLLCSHLPPSTLGKVFKNFLIDNKKNFALEVNGVKTCGVFYLEKVTLHKENTAFSYDQSAFDKIAALCLGNAHKTGEVSYQEKMLFDLLRDPDILLESQEWGVSKEGVSSCFKENFLPFIIYRAEFCNISLKNFKNLEYFTLEQIDDPPVILKVDFEFKNNVTVKDD